MLKKVVLKYSQILSKLAESLGISPAAISQWGDVISEKNAYQVQDITNGELNVDSKLYRNS